METPGAKQRSLALAKDTLTIAATNILQLQTATTAAAGQTGESMKMLERKKKKTLTNVNKVDLFSLTFIYDMQHFPKCNLYVAHDNDNNENDVFIMSFPRFAAHQYSINPSNHAHR